MHTSIGFKNKNLTTRWNFYPQTCDMFLIQTNFERYSPIWNWFKNNYISSIRFVSFCFFFLLFVVINGNSQERHLENVLDGVPPDFVPWKNVLWKWSLSIWSFEKMSSTLKRPFSKTWGTFSDNANQVILFIVEG
jgi:hypothetical protein